MKKQEAVWVNSGNDVGYLNKQFENGWVWVNSCPMPSCGDPGSYPTGLVIIEKEEK